MCRSNKNEKVNERLMLKMSEQAPGDLLVEKYLVEIAKSHNVPFKANPDIAIRDPGFFYASLDRHEAAIAKRNDNDGNDGSSGYNGGNSGNGGSGGGGSGASSNVSLITNSSRSFDYVFCILSEFKGFNLK
jgi:vacuolar protein sorting-associated protein IST1